MSWGKSSDATISWGLGGACNKHQCGEKGLFNENDGDKSVSHVVVAPCDIEIAGRLLKISWQQ